MLKYICIIQRRKHRRKVFVPLPRLLASPPAASLLLSFFRSGFVSHPCLLNLHESGFPPLRSLLFYLENNAGVYCKARRRSSAFPVSLYPPSLPPRRVMCAVCLCCFLFSSPSKPISLHMCSLSPPFTLIQSLGVIRALSSHPSHPLGPCNAMPNHTHITGRIVFGLSLCIGLHSGVCREGAVFDDQVYPPPPRRAPPRPSKRSNLKPSAVLRCTCRILQQKQNHGDNNICSALYCRFLRLASPKCFIFLSHKVGLHIVGHHQLVCTLTLSLVSPLAIL